MNKLFIDAGNSFLKLAIFKSSKLIQNYRLTYSDLSHQLDHILTGSSFQSIWIANVNQTLDINNLQQTLKHYSQQIILFKNDNYPLISTQYQSLKQLGVDRWLGILYPFIKQQQNYLIIDCGSAITVDLVINQQHIGGHIVPGIQTSLDSLKLKTNLHSQFDNIDSLYTVGQNTNQCILSGIVSSTIAYIETMIIKLEELARNNYTIWLCGGDAELIASYLNCDYNLCTNLILDSLYEVSNLPKPLKS